MCQAILKQEFHLLQCKEAFKTATKLDNLRVINIYGILKTRWEHFDENISLFNRQLQTFDEACTIKIGKDGKIRNHGAPCMLVSYSHDCNENAYCRYNPNTKWVLESRNMIWLKWIFFPEMNTTISIVWIMSLCHKFENPEI